MSADKKALDLLLNASKQRKPCPPIRHIIGEGNLEGAYELQAAVNEARVAGGAKPVGAKIGLTSKAVREQLGLNEPDYGVLFDDMQLNSGDTVPWKSLIQPKVEAEVAFVLQKDLDQEKITRFTLISSIKEAFVAIEIVDSRIKDWDIDITDTIADNASSGMFALGERSTRLTEVDLQRARMELKKNGEVTSKGMTGASLDSPINALQQLAEKMKELGTPLRAGSIILSGAVGPVVDVAPGDHIEATIEGLGGCTVRFGK